MSISEMLRMISLETLYYPDLRAPDPSRAKDGREETSAKKKMSQAEQSKRFVATARKLGVDESEAGHE